MMAHTRVAGILAAYFAAGVAVYAASPTMPTLLGLVSAPTINYVAPASILFENLHGQKHKGIHSNLHRI